MATPNAMMGIASGVASTTITKSRPFRALREAVSDRSELGADFIQCPYCMGHWIATAAVLATGARIWPVRY